ncbi:HIT family protein [Petrachloros mirabilis]
MTDLGCKACDRTWPRGDHFIADLGLSTAYLHEDQFFRGWTVVVLKRHATELFHLSATERVQLMEEVSLIAQSLQLLFDARKVNYELLGNQLPHIHWHIIPRCANDPAPLEPVWRVHHDSVSLQSPMLQDRIGQIQAQLKQARHTS